MFGMEFSLISLPVIVLVGLFSVLLLYRYSIPHQDFWEKKEIPYVKPFPLFGSLLSFIKKPVHEMDVDTCKKFGRIFGYYEGTRPVLMVAEPSLLREILVRDFHIFPNRRAFNIGDPIISKMVIVVRGEDWKRIRTVITPALSIGKVKRMISIFKDHTQTLIQKFNKAIQKGEAIEAKRIYGAFAMDVIASVAFSTKLDSSNDPDNKFVAAAKNIFKPRFREKIFFLFPILARSLKISLAPPSGTNFFREVTLSIVRERKKTGQTRNDFLQLLMDTAKELSDDPESEVSKKDGGGISSTHGGDSTEHQIFKTVTKKNLSMDELVAQCVLYFLAGYETIASTITLVTYHLALHPDIQEKVHQEIVEVLKETNGELTYDALQGMKYLDCIISETLRLYPPGVRIDRHAVAEYTLGDTGITIPKGMLITVPVFALHRDPEFFPNPDKFDPDRFTDEERRKRNPYCYLPFGSGPRNCVGMRFALTELKFCLAYVIAYFKIKKSKKTQVPVKVFRSIIGFLQPVNVYVSMIPRDDNPIEK